MKRKISFLILLAFALGTNCVHASECIGKDCELSNINVETLNPVQYEISWSKPAISVEQSLYSYSYYCPFNTERECLVWNKKPVYKTTVAPRAPHLNTVRVEEMLYAINSDINISGNDAVMSPLMQRYNMLMNAADACCTSGIIYKMRESGATDDEIYDFLKDDANYFALTKRCLVMSNEDIESRYSNGVNGKMVADVRNACLCKNQDWFAALVQPFNDIYEQIPEFAESDFIYTYMDGMQRGVKIYVNQEMRNVIELLASCPK